MAYKSVPYILMMGLLCWLSSCAKKTSVTATGYIEPAELRVGQYTGMFQECGPVVCYNKDTTFEVLKEGGRYFVRFGSHTDEIIYNQPNAFDFASAESYADDSSGINFTYLFSGYCRHDSFFVIYTDGWGVHNNNLLSGKKQ